MITMDEARAACEKVLRNEERLRIVEGTRRHQQQAVQKTVLDFVIAQMKRPGARQETGVVTMPADLVKLQQDSLHRLGFVQLLLLPDTPDSVHLPIGTAEYTVRKKKSLCTVWANVTQRQGMSILPGATVVFAGHAESICSTGRVIAPVPGLNPKTTRAP